MELLDWLTWENAKAFLNSTFVASGLGALAGAAGGAWAAQKIAERVKLRQQLLQEVRNSNAAIELAQAVCSTYLNLKEQHVRRLKHAYDEQKASVQAHYQGVQEGTIAAGTQLDVGGLDLNTLANPPVRIDRLEDVVLGKLSVTGRPRIVIAMLAQSITQLAECVSHRNSLIAAYKALPGPLNNDKIAFLFGLPRVGVIDTTFGDAVDALYEQTDDCIFFSKLLTTDMIRHGERTRRDFKRRGVRGDVPGVTKISWEEPERKGLFPSEEEYATWLTGFRSRPARTYGRRAEKLTYGLKKLFRRSTFSRCLYWLCYMPSSHRADA